MYMNTRRHRVCLIAALLVVCLTSLDASARSRRVRKPSSGAVGVVQSFFRYHFAHGMSFTEANIKRRRRWLTPELYTLLLREYHREEVESKKHPDEAVFMEGDPFTNTQEHPNTFRVGRAVMRGSQAMVPVSFFLNGHVLRTARVEVSKRGRVWLIHNILPDGDEDLLKLLRRRLNNSGSN
jgi:hypothetical protein